MTDKKGKYVPIFLDWLEVTQDLSAEEKGNLIDAVVSYAANKDYDHLLTGGTRIAFRFLKGQVDRNKDISEKRSEARRNKPEENGTNENKTEQTETKMPKEKEKEKDKEKENKKRFVPPTVDEVSEYCKERNNGIDPAHFVDYYTARGWVLSNGKKVSDWRACIRTWESRDKATGKQMKVLPAQDFPQRDYSGVNGELMEDLARKMEAFTKGVV